MRLRALLSATVLALAWLSLPTSFAAAAGGTSYAWQGSANASGGDNHSWTDSKNWIPNGVPGDGDAVTIGDPDAAHCTAAVDSIPAVTLSGLALGTTECSSSLTGGPITVTGTFSWNGGTINTPLTLGAGSVGVVTGTNSHLNTLATSLDVAGTLALHGLTDSGASNQGGLRITDPHVVHVLAGGTLASSGPNAVQLLACCVNPARIVNDGTVTASGGDLLLHGIALDQHHAMNVAAGSRVVDDGAPSTAADGATYGGAGSWAILNGASLTAAGTQTLEPGFHLQLGTLAADGYAALGGRATLTGGGTVDWLGGTIEGNLTIAHGTSLVADGAHTGNGSRELSGSDGLSGGVASVLTNHGSVRFTGGAGATTGYVADLLNASDGTLELDPGSVVGTIGCCVNPSRVVNNGVLSVPAGTSTTAAHLDGVAYRVAGGSTRVAAGRTLLVTMAPSSLTSTTLTGGGRLQLDAPTAVAGTLTVTGSQVQVDAGGTLDGTATLTGTGSVRWLGGSMSGNLTLATSGGTHLGGTALKSVANLGGGTVRSSLKVTDALSFDAGTAAHPDVLDVGQSALALSGATHVAAYSGMINGRVTNTGRLVTDPGAGYALLNSTFSNRGSVAVAHGTLRVYGSYTQSAGSTSLAAGTHLDPLYSSWSITLGAGTLLGTGTVGGGVTNIGGTVSPGGTGIGTLHIAGGYVQRPGAHLALTMGSTTRDLLAVAGAATLSGTLAATDAPGYSPKMGSIFRVLTATSVAAAPGCTTTAGTASATRHWVAGRSATGLTLTAEKGAARHC